MAGVGVQARIKNYLILLLIILRDHGDPARGIINVAFPDNGQCRDVFRRGLLNVEGCRQQAWELNLTRISNILVTVFRNFCTLRLGGYAALGPPQLADFNNGALDLQVQFQQLVDDLVEVEQSSDCLDGKWRERLKDYYDHRYDVPPPRPVKTRRQFDIKRDTYMDMIRHGYNRRTLRTDGDDCSDNHIREILHGTPRQSYWVPTQRFRVGRTPARAHIRRKKAGQVLRLAGIPKTKTGALNRNSYCHFRGWKQCGGPDERRHCEGDLIDQDFIEEETQDWAEKRGELFTDMD